MSLADFSPETVAIEYRGKPLITVRGLSLDDLAVLIREHLDGFRQLSDTLGKSRAEIFAKMQAHNFILEVISKSPDMAASIIAQGSDQADEVGKIKSLPMGLQIKAIQQIVRMSVEDVGGPKAFVALVMGMLQTA